MPSIFPRYGGVSTNISSDKAVDVPLDPRPRQIQQLGAAAENAAQAFGQVAQKRQALEDEAETQKRYMQAVTDMESMTEELNVPANALQAKSLFGKHLTEREGEWFKGLSGTQSDMLKKRLFPKQLEYQVGAAKLENRAKLEDYSATMVKAQTLFAQKASRRLGPDDASETEEYKDFVRMVDTGVNVGYIRPDKGAEMKQGALTQGAYARVYQATASDSQEEVKHVLELYKQERETEGSTFLKHLDPEKRISLEKQLKERLGSLRNEEQRQKREERTETERMNAELSKATTTLAAQKLTSPEKFGPLTSDWIDLAADLRLMDDKDVILFRGEVEKRASSGTVSGYGNPQTLNRYSVAVYDTRSPEQAAKLRDELKADMAAGRVPGGPNSIGSQWLNHLEEKAVSPGDKPPSMSALTNDVKEAIKRDVRVTGPMQSMKPVEQAVMQEALRMIDENARQGYKVDPWTIYDQNIDKWQSRVGVTAQVRANEMRRSMGLPPTGKDAETTLEKHRVQLQRQFSEAPEGPEGDATRSAIREAARALKRLQELEQTMRKYQDLRGQGKAAKEQNAQQSGGAPQLGPRR